eukprot:TRINITY_DN6834_c0_g2_i1.p1 TRINITY_DN6834_c0_g2~~TRINITY_DN6834_c0_g2_i1.p1  ORF type:complete len:163 (+),score=20.20 TRINITY_DN6834_c0_g2_i1:72-491(+)
MGEIVTTIPTIGFNVETVTYKNLNFTLWDVGGQAQIRSLWRHYFNEMDLLIYVVDSYDKDRMSEAKDELTKLLNEPELDKAALLVLCNKQDLPNALTVTQITEQLGLAYLSRPWNIQACCTTTGEGLYEGLDWAAIQII